MSGIRPKLSQGKQQEVDIVGDGQTGAVEREDFRGVCWYNIARSLTGIVFGVESLRVLEYDTEQQVAGNHLLYAWETLDGDMSSAVRTAHARGSV